MKKRKFSSQYLLQLKTTVSASEFVNHLQRWYSMNNYNARFDTATIIAAEKHYKNVTERKMYVEGTRSLGMIKG